MKKTLLLFLCICLAASVFAMAAYAEGEFRTVCKPSASSLQVGQEVTITVEVENAPLLKNGLFELEYDNDVFELVSMRFLLPDPMDDLPEGMVLPLIGFDYNYADGTAVFAYKNPEDINVDTIKSGAFEFTLRVKETAPMGDTIIGIISTFLSNGVPYECADVNTTVTIADVLYGDVNGDGKVNGRDSILLAQYMADWDVEIVFANADVNADGKVNGKDSILLAQYMADWDVTLGK